MSKTLHAALFFMILQACRKIAGTIIDNSISDDPSIQCDSDSISILFSTLKPFTGRTYVKGHIQESNCVQIGNRQGKHKFTINFDQCGLRRSREYNGIRITTTVIISFHPIFLTKIDRAYRLNCFYTESLKTVTQQLDIGMMTTQELSHQTEMPICRYEILSGGNPTRVPIRFAKVGDSVYHRWTCMSEMQNFYCMRVHTCTVNDGQGGEIVEVLNKKGCSVDRFVLMDLEYTGDLVAGQEAHVFKFADRPALYFNCQLELTIKDSTHGCAARRPVCKDQVRVEPSMQTYEHPETTEEMVASSHQINRQFDYSNPTEAEYNGDKSPYSNNETKLLSPQGTSTSASSSPSSLGPPSPPGPPGVNPPGHLVYTDNNYEEEDISALGYTESYEQKITHSDAYATIHHTTSVYEETKRLVRSRRNSTRRQFSRKNTSVWPNTFHVADVDLPEQSLTVFGIEDGPPPTDQEMRSTNLNELLDLNERSRACFSTTGRLSILMATIIAALVIFTVALILLIRKQRILVYANFVK